ncbi:E3 ubiquitin ligase family protein [Natrinema marinum]|uniref:E3 ubiquitin ligase family protein n=1 Tax=Natrinema marinum TaxID=2961598 RepID=UPI0020C921A0|nr:E3 ubiquitin ligase family protein [Natrinema marinum]
MTAFAPAVLLALGAAATGYGFFDQSRRQQTLASTDRARTDTAVEGQALLTGTVEPLETVGSPVTDEEAVVVDWELSAESDDEEGPDERVASGRRAADFHLVDEGGAVRVDPTGSDLIVSGSNMVRDRVRTTAGSFERLRRFADEVEGDQSGTERDGVSVRADGVVSPNRFDRYDHHTFEHEILGPGDEVTVLGTLRRENGDGVVGDGPDRFLLSDMSPADLVSDLETKKRLLLGVTLVLAIASLYFLVLG